MDPMTRLLRANNLALSLDAIQRRDYPIAFHLLNVTFGRVKPYQIGTDYYNDMTPEEATLFRAAVNAAWRYERSQLPTATMERMSRDGKSLSELNTYLRQSGLTLVRPAMSHRELLLELVRTQNDLSTWRYSPADRYGLRQFYPTAIHDYDGLIANITRRSRPIVHWTTQVALRATATTSELFGWATVQINFGRRSQISHRQGTLLLEHVNLRCTVNSVIEADQPTGASVLDKTVEIALFNGKVSLS
jgi:hypothetical protein